ncbi:MAG: pyridoxal-phosphate-dependent aminotransferase family protein [Myxococcota bacterium]
MRKSRLMTPGPVAVPERVQLAMALPLVHHRAPEFTPIFREVRENLKRVFQTECDVLVLASTGSGAMEAAVSNLLSPGERAVVVRGGKFGERWGELCEVYGIEPTFVDVEWGDSVEPEAVRAAFEATPQARALLVQASETSTGAYHPIEALARIVRESDERLLIVDGISAVGAHDLRMDDWGIDALVSGSQKSFMLPPGLAFVALSERASERMQTTSGPRYYFDLRKEAAAQAREQTAWSAAVSLLVGLRESLRMILDSGLEATFEHHATLCRATRAAMRALGLELLARTPSHACTAVRVPEGVDGKDLVRRMRDDHGMTIAGGQSQLAGRIFRIGHLGWVDGYDMLSVVAALESVLADLGWPVKTGAGICACAEQLRADGGGA